MLKLAILAVLSLLLLPACSQEATSRAAGEAPSRIVSLDYCADQYVLKFAERRNILALSPDSEKAFSYFRNEASGIRKVRPRAADILALEPDLVVRSYGGEPTMAGFLERAGVAVVQLGFPSSLSEIRSEVLRVGTELGDAAGAKDVVVEMDRQLAALAAARPEPRTVLYMTAGGVSAGQGTLMHELITLAGHTNFQERPGWNPIPLERLASERPDLVAAAYFEGEVERRGHWSAARHPIARAQLRDLPVVPIQEAWTSCGAWFQLEAAVALANAEDRTP